MSPLNVTARAAVSSDCVAVREHAATTTTVAMTASARFAPLLPMRFDCTTSRQTWVVGGRSEPVVLPNWNYGCELLRT
jgi:hypothetical protein